MVSLYHRLSELLSFQFESSVRSLQEKGKLETFFTNSTSSSFKARTKLISMQEGAISQILEAIQLEGEKYSFQEKLFALNLELKQFDTYDDDRYENDDHLYWLVQMAKLYFEEGLKEEQKSIELNK